MGSLLLPHVEHKLPDLTATAAVCRNSGNTVVEVVTTAVDPALGVAAATTSTVYALLLPLRLSPSQAGCPFLLMSGVALQSDNKAPRSINQS